MSGFTKLYADIVDSSIWDEDSDTCKVWVTLLALKDSTGYVRGSIGWLAKKARVSVDVCVKAITILESPDPASRTEDHEGRRISRDAHGWEILNHAIFKNRRCLSDNPRNVYMRDLMRLKRNKLLTSANSANSANTSEQSKPSVSVSVSVQGKEEKGCGEREKKHSPESKIVLSYLNEKSGKRFRETETNLGFIDARLAEQEVTVDGVKQMIDRQCFRWHGTEMADYLRPETLFNRTKFDAYYAAREEPISKFSQSAIPISVQIRSAEALIETINDRLNRLNPPNENFDPNGYAEIIAKRKPLLDERKNVRARLIELRKKAIA